MWYIGAIVSFAAVAAWMTAKEIPAASGLLLPTGSMPRVIFGILSAVLPAATLLLPQTRQLSAMLAGGLGTGDGQMLLVVLSALLAVMMLDRMYLIPSLCTAFTGAVEGLKLASGHVATVDLAAGLTWLAALPVAFVIAAVLEYCLKALFNKSGIHFIVLSRWMRPVAVTGICLFFVATGMNNWAILPALGLSAGMAFPYSALAAFVILALLGRLLVHRSQLTGESLSEISLHSAISVSFAVSATLILTSSQTVCGLLNIRPTPVSIPSVVIAAMLGISAVRRVYAIEPSYAGRGLAGMALSPLLALVLAYFGSSFAYRGGSSAYPMVAAAFIFLIAGILVLYMFRRIKKSKEEAERMLAIQRQQVYENQKALNSMEIKSVLYENDRLHSTLESKRKELVDIALIIGEQKEYLTRLSDKIRAVADTGDNEERDRLLADMDREIRQRLQSHNITDDFYAKVESLHKDFSVKLSESFPNLTQQERKLATLLRLGFSTKYIASLMFITPKSVEIERYRLRAKLGLKRGENLINFIKSI